MLGIDKIKMISKILVYPKAGTKISSKDIEWSDKGMLYASCDNSEKKKSFEGGGSPAYRLLGISTCSPDKSSTNPSVQHSQTRMRETCLII